MKEYQDIIQGEAKFRYQMLSRLKMDCGYYLGNGGRSNNVLWAKDEVEHIELMKAIWNSFDQGDKPEWLSMADIEEYEKKMTS